MNETSDADLDLDDLVGDEDPTRPDIPSPPAAPRPPKPEEVVDVLYRSG